MCCVCTNSCEKPHLIIEVLINGINSEKRVQIHIKSIQFLIELSNYSYYNNISMGILEHSTSTFNLIFKHSTSTFILISEHSTSTFILIFKHSTSTFNLIFKHSTSTFNLICKHSMATFN